MVAPQPLYQMVQTIDLQRGTVEICLDTDVWPKEKAKRTWGSSLLAPLQMRGVGPQEWNIISNKLQEVFEANPFVSACGEDSAAYAECCYFCSGTIFSCLPRIVLRSITGPLDSILQLAFL